MTRQATPAIPERKMDDLVRHVAAPWARHGYYDRAEPLMDRQWEGGIWPLIGGFDFEVTVELACGHGRNSERLRQLAQCLILVDVNRENIDHCRRRFEAASNVFYYHNDGATLSQLDPGIATTCYSFDAMVHFDPDVVRSYLAEVARVLRPGGRAFLHHSNYRDNPCGDVYDNPGWRNFMSMELFAHYATREGLTVTAQRKVNWIPDVEASDGYTLLRKD